MRLVPVLVIVSFAGSVASFSANVVMAKRPVCVVDRIEEYVVVVERSRGDSVRMIDVPFSAYDTASLASVHEGQRTPCPSGR